MSAVEESVQQPAGSAPPHPEPASAESARSADRGWVWPVSALSVVLGAMLALTVRSNSQTARSPSPAGRLGVSAAFVARYQEQNARLQAEIKDLRRQLGTLESSVKSDSRATHDLSEQLRQVKALAGLSAVSGTGLSIRLQDSTEIPGPGELPEEYLIHDQDINSLINELKSAGAQHMAISGADPTNLQRITVKTTARCVGPTAVVNGTPLAAPYHLKVIGDPAALRAALEAPDGFVARRKLAERKMIVVEDAPTIELPEFSGPFTAKYARPVGREPVGREG